MLVLQQLLTFFKAFCFIKWCLHRRKNNKYLSLPLAMAILKDGKSFVYTASLSKIARPTFHVTIGRENPKGSNKHGMWAWQFC
jgi:hypothetical protein